MSKVLWHVLTDHSCTLGECPLWDPENQRLLWVDIHKGEIHGFNQRTARHNAMQVGQNVGSIALCKSGRILAALEYQFAFIRSIGDSPEVLSNFPEPVPGVRFNDGKCDPRGRFWVGSMHKQGKTMAGSVVVLQPNGSITTAIRKLSVPNGMAWSTDHQVFYFIDTPAQQVVAYDYNERSGQISHKRTVIEIPEDMGRPDGMTIDTEGKLWIALWDGGSVGRWDPASGKLLRSIKLPFSRPTSCTFGGRDLHELYVTSASLGLSDRELEQQPLAGKVLVLRETGAKGIATYRFSD